MAKKAAKAAPLAISKDEWLAALQETSQLQVDRDDSLITYEDFSEMTGIGINTARRRLRAIVKAGLATQTTKRILANDGKLRLAIAFRLKKKP